MNRLNEILPGLPLEQALALCGEEGWEPRVTYTAAPPPRRRSDAPPAPPQPPREDIRVLVVREGELICARFRTLDPKPPEEETHV